MSNPVYHFHVPALIRALIDAADVLPLEAATGFALIEPKGFGVGLLEDGFPLFPPIKEKDS